MKEIKLKGMQERSLKILKQCNKKDENKVYYLRNKHKIKKVTEK